MNTLMAARNGGSIKDIAQAASDGLMWGAISGPVAGGTKEVLNAAANAGKGFATNFWAIQALFQAIYKSSRWGPTILQQANKNWFGY